MLNPPPNHWNSPYRVMITMAYKHLQHPIRDRNLLVCSFSCIPSWRKLWCSESESAHLSPMDFHHPEKNHYSSIPHKNISSRSGAIQKTHQCLTHLPGFPQKKESAQDGALQSIMGGSNFTSFLPQIFSSHLESSRCTLQAACMTWSNHFTHPWTAKFQLPPDVKSEMYRCIQVCNAFHKKKWDWFLAKGYQDTRIQRISIFRLNIYNEWSEYWQEFGSGCYLFFQIMFRCFGEWRGKDTSIFLDEILGVGTSKNCWFKFGPNKWQTASRSKWARCAC